MVGQALATAALIEEYIDGAEYSAEVIVDRNGPRTLVLCEKVLGPLPYFVEIGHRVPARLDAGADAKLRNTAEAAVRALGVGNCVCHVELRVSGAGVSVIEVNLRPAGGRLPEFIWNVTGYDLHKAAIAIAVTGEAPAFKSTKGLIGK